MRWGGDGEADVFLPSIKFVKPGFGFVGFFFLLRGSLAILGR